jgi:hypothetical protein
MHGNIQGQQRQPDNHEPRQQGCEGQGNSAHYTLRAVIRGTGILRLMMCRKPEMAIARAGQLPDQFARERRTRAGKPVIVE